MRYVERFIEERIHDRAEAITVCNGILAITKSQLSERKDNSLAKTIREQVIVTRKNLFVEQQSDKRFIRGGHQQRRQKTA